MATEKRLIEADKLKTAMYLIAAVCNTENIFIDAIIDEIDNADDVDAVEVKHGWWVPTNLINNFSCSQCKHRYISGFVKTWNYCPNCGANMRGNEE